MKPGTRFLYALLCLGATVSCGYHVGGKADHIPEAVRTLAIPAFASFTTDYRIGDLLPAAIAHEMTERTRFEVVKDPAQADAILKGSINRVSRAPALSDPTTGKTTSVQLLVTLNVSLVERMTGKVLFSRPSFVLRENYELAADPHQLFDESAPAFKRMSQNLARDIVSAVIEDF